MAKEAIMNPTEIGQFGKSFGKRFVKLESLIDRFLCVDMILVLNLYFIFDQRFCN
jgi:hypothetical protein